jgi:hypothetical protein
MGMSHTGHVRRLASCLAIGLAAVTVFGGCGSGAAKVDTSTQATVSGSITNDAKPVTPESSVVFFCAELSATAAGTLDVLGKFSLRAADPKIGIPAGRYQVMVRPPEPPAVKATDQEYRKVMMGGPPAGNVAPKAANRAPDIPEKFQSLDSSGITLEIKPGPNTIDLDLAKLAN